MPALRDFGPTYVARWVIRVRYEQWRVVGHARSPPKPDVASTNESFVERGRWRTAKARDKNKAARRTHTLLRQASFVARAA
jgi:hypothetical protein